MKTREEMDRLAWTLLEARPASTGRPQGYALSGRPANLPELARMIEETGDFEHAWSEFRHEFFVYKSDSFFAEPAPSFFSIKERAFLAAAAEALSIRFGLHVPSWTQERDYTLHQPWDPSAFLYPDVSLDARKRMSSPVFLKHNVLGAERDLIAL